MVTISTLPNGMRTVGERIPHYRSAALGVWVGVGSMQEQQREHGLSHLIEHMVFKGTANRSARELAAVMDAVGGHLNDGKRSIRGRGARRESGRPEPDARQHAHAGALAGALIRDQTTLNRIKTSIACGLWFIRLILGSSLFRPETTPGDRNPMIGLP